MLDCPNCGSSQAKKLIAQVDAKILKCNLCYESTYSVFKTAKYWNLGQTIYNDGKVKVTNGKAFEIDNRVVGPEGKVINKVTGKPAQY